MAVLIPRSDKSATLTACFLLLALSMGAGCSDGSSGRSGTNSEGSTPNGRLAVSDLVFADENLASCVAEAAADNGWTYIDEITELVCGLRDIETLEGMETLSASNAPVLFRLDLQWNRVSDISPLGSLTQLTELNLSGNRNYPPDLAPIAGMTELRIFSITPNNFTDLGPLANLTNLQELSLRGSVDGDGSHGILEDLSPLSGLTSLTFLDLSSNSRLADLSPISGLTNLQTLHLKRMKSLRDLRPLGGLINLRELDLWQTEWIDNAAGLETLVNLRKLVLYGIYVSDLSGIAGLQELTHLEIVNTAIDNVDFVANLTRLETLQFATCHDPEECTYQPGHITDISGITSLVNLVYLSIFNQPITDVTPLAGLTNLQRLQLYSGQIRDVGPLSGLIALKLLALDQNQVTDLGPLINLKELFVLSLTNNGLSDLTPLAALTSLGGLYLAENDIQDLSPLSGLTPLEVLNLRDNRVRDVSPLVSLTALRTLDLKSNGLDDITPLTMMPWLEALDVQDNRVSCEEVTELEQALPETEIRSRGCPR